MAYVGQIIDIPFGRAGLTGTRNLLAVRPDQLIEASNVSYEGGTLQKEPGALRYNAALAGAPAILGGWDWWPDTSTQRMVILTSAGTLLKDAGLGTFPVTLKTGLTTAGVVPVFVEAGKEAVALPRRLFVFTGRNPVQVLEADGATTADVATPPTDWAGINQPLAGALHEGRVWGAGNPNDPHRWYYSAPDNHVAFTGAGTGNVPVYPGEGDGIIAGASFKKLLITWKRPRGVYYVDTQSPDVNDWKPVVMSTSVDLASPGAWAVIEDDLLFMDGQGSIHLLSAVQEYGNVGTSNLSQVWDLDQYARDHFNIGAGFGAARALYYPAKRQATFAVPGLGSAVNNQRLVLYREKADQVLPSVSPRDVCVSLWLRRDAGGIHRPMMGDATGTVWRLDQPVRSKDGVGYEARAATGHLDFSHVDPALASKRKNGQFLEIFWEPRGDWLVYFDIYWDDRRTQTIAAWMGPGGTAVLGSTFILGTAVLGSLTGIRSMRKRMAGGGRRLQIIARNAVAGQDFSISHLRVHCTISDEAQRPR
jgi:hypothetical protein